MLAYSYGNGSSWKIKCFALCFLKASSTYFQIISWKKWSWYKYCCFRRC